MRSKPKWQTTRPPILPLLMALETLALSALPATAHAVDCAPAHGLSSCIDADNLWPRPGSGPFFSLAPTATSPASKASFGLVFSYLSRPVGLHVASPDPLGTTIYVLDNMLDASFLWSLGLTDRFEITLAAPVTLYQDGAGLADVLGTDTELPRSVIRDPRLGLAFAILPRPRTGLPQGFALTSRFDLGIPAGTANAFAGASTVTAVPSIVADFRLGIFDFASEIGARIRGPSTLAGVSIGSQLSAALGTSVDILKDRWLTASAEAFALYTLSKQPPSAFNPDVPAPPLVPAEWIVGVSSAPLLGGDFAISLGGGGPIPFSSESAVTTPRFRFDLGLRYAPTGRDTDEDLVLDRDDRCPLVPEDRDGFQDADGCPDPDNDGDRILDVNDRCRDEPETVDGFKDQDGCPDPDDDDDGISDELDKCRNAPEDRDGFQDSDGCPDPDNDNDGIEDKRDQCPNGAEDFDGFKDEDGCADPDNDLDQILDDVDQCPSEMEDKDGFEDNDGCPEPDNDEDGVLDGADACPITPETIDGNSDQDGCPEPGARSLVSWSGDQIVVEQLAKFAPANARMDAKLEGQIRMIAQLIRGRMPIQVVIVEAYADRVGDASARALDLSAARASAVKEVLVTADIPADLITAAAGDPATKRTPRSPQIEISVTRIRRAKPSTATQEPQ